MKSMPEATLSRYLDRKPHSTMSMATQRNRGRMREKLPRIR
jgi:hypothetical protein